MINENFHLRARFRFATFRITLGATGGMFTYSGAQCMTDVVLNGHGSACTIGGGPEDRCDQCGAPRAPWQGMDDARCPMHAVPEPYSSCDGVLRKMIGERFREDANAAQTVHGDLDE